MAEDATGKKAPRSGRGRTVAFVLAAVVLLSLSGAAWVGPSAFLRLAVRTVDPALRLELGGTAFRDGSLRLRDVGIFLRGGEEPVFRAAEIALGFGHEWRKGRFGSLTLVEPALSLDKRALDHFSSGGTSSAPAWAWEIGEVAIIRGHLWLAQFGDPALDISVNVDGVLQRVGPSAPEQIHELDLSRAYVAVYENGTPVPLFGAGRMGARVSIGGLVGRKLHFLRVDQGWLLAGSGLQTLASPAASAAPAPARADGGAFVLQVLDLVALQIDTGEFSGSLPRMSLTVNTALRDVALGAASGELAEKVHQIEFDEVQIMSPLDPLKKVVTIRTLFAGFSFAGLARGEIERLSVLGPNIYVGESLFEYMRIGEAADAAPSGTPGEWLVKELEVNFGRLTIAVAGRSQIGLPLGFETRARNLSLSSLAGLNLDLLLTIPSDDYDFPSYDLSLHNVRGEVRLNFPPHAETNNLVDVVRCERARWRNFTGRDLWISVTFDLQGIHGLFGGAAYGGYVSGGFGFFLSPESPWTGWVTGTGLDLDRLTADGAPQHFTMTGRADASVQINGSAARIERLEGSLTGRGKGRMVVNKLNDMLAAIPPEWWSVKRDLTRVSLETLRDFDYDSASADFWFVADRGKARVRMRGPAGSRNIDLVLHGDGTGSGVWSQ
ncbi:MAG: hypothetical protein ACO3G9_05360 [Chthoniobacterales bacterium]